MDHASERHLVIVLDSFSQAGMGIPLGMTDRDEPGAGPLRHAVARSAGAADPRVVAAHDGGIGRASLDTVRWVDGPPGMSRLTQEGCRPPAAKRSQARDQRIMSPALIAVLRASFTCVNVRSWGPGCRRLAAYLPQ